MPLHCVTGFWTSIATKAIWLWWLPQYLQKCPYQSCFQAKVWKILYNQLFLIIQKDYEFRFSIWKSYIQIYQMCGIVCTYRVGCVCLGSKTIACQKAFVSFKHFTTWQILNKSLTATTFMYNSCVAVSCDIASPHNECSSEKVCEKCFEINESIRKQSQSWGDIVLTSCILQLCFQPSPRGAAARAGAAVACWARAPSHSQEYLQSHS